MSSGKPVDLIELARQAGVAQAQEQALQARRDLIQLITFERNRDPGRDLPVGRHPATNRIVFPDMKRHGVGIKPGETYFCDLIEYHPPGGPSVYYANPITKVDASYLFDLHPEQVDRLVDALLRSAQGQVFEQARAQIQNRVEQATKVTLDSLASERDALRGENRILKSEVEMLRGAATVTPPTADPTGRGRRAATPGPMHQQSLSSSAALSAVPPVPSAPCELVQRPAADSLKAPLLGEGHFFAHVSPNRETLFIHPHPEGNLRAVGSVLGIPGLSVLRPFDGEEELLASVDQRVGGLSIRLSTEAQRI
jgi:hypothetical protein